MIITSHNDSDLGVRALKSVSRQVLSPHEIIVAVDDSEVPHTRRWREACSDLPIPCTILQTSSRGRPAAARNEAAQAAVGDWLAFLDSDDIWFRWKLSAFATSRRRNPDAFLFYHSVTQTAAAPRIPFLPILIAGKPPTSACHFAQTLPRMTFSSIVVQTSAFWSAGGFDESPDLRSVEDAEFIWRALQLERRVARILIPCGNYLLRQSSISSTVGTPSLDFLLGRFRQDCASIKDVEPLWIHMARVSRFVRSGCWKEAKQSALSGLDVSGQSPKSQLTFRLFLFFVRLRLLMQSSYGVKD